MPSLLPLLLLLLSLSFHATDGRHLHITHNEYSYSSRSSHHSSKDVEKVKATNALQIPARPVQYHEQEPMEGGAVNENEQRPSVESPKSVDGDGEVAPGGDENVTPSSSSSPPPRHAGFQPATEVEGLGGSGEQVQAGEATDEIGGGVVGIDYEDPERGPSVHNK